MDITGKPIHFVYVTCMPREIKSCLLNKQRLILLVVRKMRNAFVAILFSAYLEACVSSKIALFD